MFFETINNCYELKKYNVASRIKKHTINDYYFYYNGDYFK